jgi:hypothetical protein
MVVTTDAFQQMLADVALIAGERSFKIQLEYSTIWKPQGELSWYVWVSDLGTASGSDNSAVLRNLRAQAAAQATIDATPEPSNALAQVEIRSQGVRKG